MIILTTIAFVFSFILATFAEDGVYWRIFYNLLTLACFAAVIIEAANLGIVQIK